MRSPDGEGWERTRNRGQLAFALLCGIRCGLSMLVAQLLVSWLFGAQGRIGEAVGIAGVFAMGMMVLGAFDWRKREKAFDRKDPDSTASPAEAELEHEPGGASGGSPRRN